VPGINQTELAKMLALKKQTVAYNVWVLADDGVIEVRTIGNKTHLHIAKEPVGQEVPE
jgi:predicted transcriptional regulator